MLSSEELVLLEQEGLTLTKAAKARPVCFWQRVAARRTHLALALSMTAGRSRSIRRPFGLWNCPITSLILDRPPSLSILVAA